MFQLYKKRSFGDMISDTFAFLKITGKHFFKNYFILIGAFLLVLLVLSYFVFKVYFEYAFSSVGAAFGNNPLQSTFGDNPAVIFLVFLLFFLLIIFISLLTYSFPISYFRLYDKHKQTTNFTSKDIANEMKANFGKVVVFFLIALLIFVVIMFVIGFIIAILSLASIILTMLFMFPLLFIIIPMLYIWFTQSFYHQLNTNHGVMASLSSGWSNLMNNFWPILGSTIIIYAIITIIGYIISMIPYIFGIGGMFGLGSSPDSFSDYESMSFFEIMMIITTLLSMLTSFITYNLLFINQGMIYYSSVEQKENRMPQSEIDLIGMEE